MLFKRKTHKSKPYQKIMDIEEEQKEYGLLCRGKSKKYKVYTEWEQHILENLEKCKLRDDLYNFKRYCINADRSVSKAPDMFINYIIFFLTIAIEKFVVEINGIIWLVGFLLSLFYSIYSSKRLVKESYFFADIIELIEKVEKGKEQSFPVSP